MLLCQDIIEDNDKGIGNNNYQDVMTVVDKKEGSVRTKGAVHTISVIKEQYTLRTKRS